jgi:phenylalanyl-tRNA synthetase beta chain
MNILTNWLRTYVPNIPVDDQQLAEDLTLRGVAVEGVHSLGRDNGHLFEMDITTNRVDAMNHYGIAREAATIYNLPLSPLINESSSRPEPEAKWRDPRISPVAAQTSETPFPITIEAKDLCGRFTAQILRNITIAPSTGKISEYFNLLTQKQISNAVDASNFVLLGMGHPTHAFDLDKLEGGIIVRLAHKGEKLKLLDGTERTLEPDDLVVADHKKALALAGVMGGWDSMITAETKNILVEAAWFDPASVRRSSRRHGLHTDASHRFERGADFNAAPTANALVSQLILEAGGQAEGSLIDIIIPEIAARTASRPPIQLSVKQVQRHLGTTVAPEGITSEIVHQYLTALGCVLVEKSTSIVPTLVGEAVVASRYPEASASGLSTGEVSRGFSHWGMSSSVPGTTFSVQLPSWRLDLEREIDLIEEVARVYGYNRFANTLPTAMPVIAHPIAAKEAAIRTRLLALGFSESISTTFASQADANLFYTSGSTTNPGAPSSTTVASSAKVGHRASDPSFSNVATTVPMENPLSEEASLLRPSLIPGMLNMLAHNLNRDVKNVRLFEQGQIFTGIVPPDGTFISDVHESPQLSIGLTGNITVTEPYTAESPHFFDLKGAIESIVSLFTPPGGSLSLTFTAEAPAWLQPGRSATALINNEPLAHFGELASSEASQRKLRQPVFLAQIDLARLYELPLKKITAHDLSRFQAVERDFSFVMPDGVQWHTTASAIHALSIPELQSLKPVEVWRDQKKYPGVYSLLVRTVFQSHDRTLRDDELTAWSTAIITTLTKLGGTLRASV